MNLLNTIPHTHSPLTVPQIAENFYMATWDLSENISWLPIALANKIDTFTPLTIATAFKNAAQPFFDLDGTDIPKDLHDIYDDLETIARTEILPSLEVLQEEWTDLKLAVDNNQLNMTATLAFTQKCVFLCNRIELELIPNGSSLEQQLAPL